MGFAPEVVISQEPFNNYAINDFFPVTLICRQIKRCNKKKETGGREKRSIAKLEATLIESYELELDSDSSERSNYYYGRIKNHLLLHLRRCKCHPVEER